MAITDPLQDERSWRFALDEDGVDPVLGYRYLEEAYLARDPEEGTENGVSVPAIVEESTGLLVTNDYPQITVDLGIEWAKYQRPGAPSLYPPELREEIDAVNEGVFHDVNNGVYKTGFATTQNAYETAYTALFARLDELDERLANQRYLVGDHITEADIRLFTTLARFDAVYHGHFKCNRQKLAEFEHLWPAHCRPEMEEVMQRVFTEVNNGVYRCGFAGSQEAYEDAYDRLFTTLDWLEDRLGDRRYLMGDAITEADVRLFTTLARFDPVYHGHFKCNRAKLDEMPVL
jgi:glutathionyl-hydroquinone reductase